MRVVVRALAKINLHLEVHGRRPDGYHDLTTVFQTIALGDRIRVESWDGPFVLLGGSEGVPPDSTNLVWRAAELAATEAGRDLSGVRIALHKFVPIQAGLGGGSADAMATLRALQSLWGVSFETAALERMGARLGADVAFFARGGTALGTGRGEQLAGLPDFPDHHVVIAQPAFGVSTAAAYQWLSEARVGAEAPAVRPGFWPERSQDWRSRLRTMANDFEAVVVRYQPEVRTGLDALAAAGAALALMSGSGSAIAGLFSTEAEARAAAAEFDGRPGWRVWLSQTISRAVYQAAVAPVRLPP